MELRTWGHLEGHLTHDGAGLEVGQLALLAAAAANLALHVQEGNSSIR